MDRDEGKERKTFLELIDKLDPFWNDHISRVPEFYYYSIPEGNSLLQELLTYAEKHSNSIEISIMSVMADYSEDELSRAKAFIPTIYNNCYYEYDDVFDAHEYCEVCGGEKHFEASLLSSGKSYGAYRLAKPEGKIRQEGKSFILRNEDDPMIVVVSTCMYEALVKQGIGQEHFRAVKSKRGKVLGYELVTDDLLPTGCLSSERFLLEEKCNVCGNSSFVGKETLHYEPYYLRNIDAIPADVCMTSDYYDNSRMLLISPGLRDLIVDLDSEASFLPVF